MYGGRHKTSKHDRETAPTKTHTTATPSHAKAYKLCAVPEPRNSSKAKDNRCGDLRKGNGKRTKMSGW